MQKLPHTIPESSCGCEGPHKAQHYTNDTIFIFGIVAMKKVAFQNPHLGLCKVQNHTDNTNMPFPIDLLFIFVVMAMQKIDTHNSRILT